MDKNIAPFFIIASWFVFLLIFQSHLSYYFSYAFGPFLLFCTSSKFPLLSSFTTFFLSDFGPSSAIPSPNSFN